MLAPGGSISTDTSNVGKATPGDPAIVKVTLPNGGTAKLGGVQFTADHVDDVPGGGSGVARDQAGREFGSLQINLDLTRTGDAPAVIELDLDPSMFTTGADFSTLQVMLNGVVIPDCPPSGPLPETCIVSRGTGVGDDLRLVISTTHNSVLTFSVAPTDRTSLFCAPVDDKVTRFGDVAVLSPHKDAVECLADAGLFAGAADGVFNPAGSLTRGQASSVLVALADELGIALPAASPVTFKDVPGAAVHESAIGRLASSGIMLGFGDGTFRAGAGITRGQFASMIATLFTLATSTTPATVDVFGDDDGTVFEMAMNRAAALGLVTGTGPSAGSAGTVISRGEAASILGRFAGRLAASR